MGVSQRIYLSHTHTVSYGGIGGGAEGIFGKFMKCLKINPSAAPSLIFPSRRVNLRTWRCPQQNNTFRISPPRSPLLRTVIYMFHISAQTVGASGHRRCAGRRRSRVLGRMRSTWRMWMRSGDPLAGMQSRLSLRTWRAHAGLFWNEGITLSSVSTSSEVCAGGDSGGLSAVSLSLFRSIRNTE